MAGTFEDMTLHCQFDSATHAMTLHCQFDSATHAMKLTMSVPMQMSTMAMEPIGRGIPARMKKRNGVSSGILAVSA